MFLDVVDLRNFYSQPLGIVARRLLSHAIRTRWPNTRGLALVGLGYATPYLGVFRDEVERTFALMPSRQGVVKWPTAAPSLSALVEDALLPLPDASVDRVLAVHALEMTIHAPDMLREALFTPVGWSEALWLPPLTRVPFLRTAVAWERVGRTLSLPFAGVHIVEATKQ